jgi:hypothetical protein
MKRERETERENDISEIQSPSSACKTIMKFSYLEKPDFFKSEYLGNDYLLERRVDGDVTLR